MKYTNLKIIVVAIFTVLFWSCDKDDRAKELDAVDNGYASLGEINDFKDKFNIMDDFNTIVTKDAIFDLRGNISVDILKKLEKDLENFKNVIHLEEDSDNYVYLIPSEKNLDEDEVFAYIDKRKQKADFPASKKSNRFEARYTILLAEHPNGRGRRILNWYRKIRKIQCGGHYPLLAIPSFGKDADKASSLFVNIKAVDNIKQKCGGSLHRIGIAIRLYDNKNYYKTLGKATHSFGSTNPYQGTKAGVWQNLKSYNSGLTDFVDNRVNGIRAKVGLISHEKKDWWFGKKWKSGWDFGRRVK